MRDIGTRIQRYRLSRYGSGTVPLRRRLRWAWPLAAVWMVYIGLLSDHSLFRIWRLSAENIRMRVALDETRGELERLERQIHDPKARRDWAERTLRERNWWARPGEIIYRVPGEGADSLSR